MANRNSEETQIEFTRSWIEISSGAFSHNVQMLVNSTSRDSLTLCLTANAYGHGLVQMAHLAEHNPTISKLCISNDSDSTLLKNAALKKALQIHEPAHSCQEHECYGLSEDPKTSSLIPLLTWKTKILRCKEIADNTPVGYAKTALTTRTTLLGILPIGYADGLGRALSNRYSVLVHGKSAPVMGLVSMNLMAIDLTDIPQAQPHDEVIVAGPQTFANFSQLGFVTSLEFTSRLHPEISRIITP